MNSSMSSATVSAINALLPQTQCRQCGYQGCLPYAEAIAMGEAPINRCPPGGTEGILRLAALTRQVVLPLDESCGVTKPLLIAKVDEANCIGCTLCIQACPVDAIVGAAKHMHTILADRCTGCELCLPPCPTECIEMLPSEDGDVDFPAPLGFERAVIARDAHAARLLRLQRDKDERAKRLAEKTQTSATNNTTTTAVVAEAAPTSQPADPRMAAIMAAMARAKQQLGQK